MPFVVVAGTGTEVGKTYVTAAVARLLRERGVAVAARKPVQSFEIGDSTTDADELADATGAGAYDVCPAHRWIPRAMAPPIAAEALGFPPFTIADLAREVAASAPAGTLVLVESAGGVRSPLASDGDTVALAAALAPALVVLVADAGLGTINAVRLSVAALEGRPVLVYLNRYDETDELHTSNRAWLASRDGLDVVTDVETISMRLAAVATG